MSFEFLNTGFEFKVDGGADGAIDGYGSVFNNIDQGGDVIARGAFEGAVASRVKMLWQHDPQQPIGVWDELVEDAKGLRLKGRFALKTAKGAEAYELAKMGALDGLSIGYTLGKDGFRYDEATNVRTLTKLDLMEVSLVTFPMNTRATVTRVKSVHYKHDLEQRLRDAGLSIDDAKHVVGLTSLPNAYEPPSREVSPELAALVKELSARQLVLG